MNLTMFSRSRKNRRKQSERKLRLPAINWRSLGFSAGTLAVTGIAVLLVMWAFNQPI